MAFSQVISGVDCDKSLCSSSSVARILDPLVPFPNPIRTIDLRKNVRLLAVYPGQMRTGSAQGEELGWGEAASPLFVEKIINSVKYFHRTIVVGYSWRTSRENIQFFYCSVNHILESAPSPQLKRRERPHTINNCSAGPGGAHLD